MRKPLRSILLLFLFVGIALTGLFWIQKDQLPDFAAVKQSYVPSDLHLLDRNGEILDEIRIDANVRRLSWIDLEQLPVHFSKLLFHAEDKRFERHHGVDWLSLGSAVLHFPFRKSGASTITMQLVSFLDPKLKAKKSKSPFQKLRQITDAILIEYSWSKKEILEAYVNLLYFRGELQGVHAATKGIFQKQPQGLSVEESAILVALIQQPNAKVERVKSRACRIGKTSELLENCETLDAQIARIDLNHYTIDRRISLASHVARKLLKNQKQDVKSTLDRKLQVASIEAIHRHLDTLGDQNVNDASVLVLDNQSGEVLAYVGNSGSEESYYVDGVQSMRQAGSTLKPFLYALAFQQKILTPNSILNDGPLEIPVSGGTYRPKNYDEKFHGKVKVRTALGSSMNVPAVKTIQLVGVEEFVDVLKQLGFDNLNGSEFYGPSLALGSADVSLWQLTNAYRVLANYGRHSLVKFVASNDEHESEEVFTKDVSLLIGNILSDSDNRSLAFGLGNALSGNSWWAVKTGTSKDMRDNWCVGYSDRYTVGVWVGNFTGQPMWNVSGVTGAAPIFS